MKINENSNLTTSQAQASQIYEKTRLEGSLSSASAPANSGDNIDLGSQASLLSLAQGAGAAESSETVQRLRALVQSGEYQVDTAGLSQSIVNSAINGY